MTACLVALFAFSTLKVDHGSGACSYNTAPLFPREAQMQTLQRLDE